MMRVPSEENETGFWMNDSDYNDVMGEHGIELKML